MVCLLPMETSVDYPKGDPNKLLVGMDLFLAVCLCFNTLLKFFPMASFSNTFALKNKLRLLGHFAI